MEINKSLRDELNDLKKIVQTQEEAKSKSKIKKFKIPFKGKVSKGKVKKGYTTILYINENREITFTKEQITDGTVLYKDTPYLATTDYMLTYKSKPVLIIPSWSVKPFSPEENYNKTVQEQNSSVGYRYLLNRMKTEVISTKKKMGALIWIILGIAVIGGIWYLSKSGGLKLF